MANSIVAEILRNDNYDDWSACMRNYLLAHDLWDLIEDQPNSTEPPPNDEGADDDDDDGAKFKTWRRKNATALHAIQISCRPDMLVKIGKTHSAKTAWDNLAEYFRKPLQQQVSQGSAFHDEAGQFFELAMMIRRDDSWSTKYLSNQNPDIINGKVTSFGETALHIATRSGNAENVGKVVELMSVEALAIKDYNGNTALHLAAFAGITKMVTYMVEKNPELVTLENNTGFLPVVLACANGHRDMTIYLYTETPFELLSDSQEGSHGSSLLQYAIISKMLDIALDILQRCPSLATAKDTAVFNRTAFSVLSMSRDIFRSGCHLGFWQRCIYSRISTTPFTPGYVTYEQRLNSESKSIMQQGKLHGLCSEFLKFLGIKQMYDLKMIHVYSYQLLDIMCGQISTLDKSESNHNGLSGVFMNAVELGAVELVIEMVKVCPSLLEAVDQNGRNPVMSSVVNRQEKAFRFFIGLAGTHARNNFMMDRFGNSVLHLAGMLSPSSQLDRISGPALQMQRELQWYKQVESIIHPAAKYTTNQIGETPSQLFTNEHEHLMIEGANWLKGTASSCTVVGALIITIMFAAAFTVPGGNVQDGNPHAIGTPVFLGQKAFKTFIISDVMSLFASSASVVTFLGILTSSYGEQDFLESLPRKLIIGLLTLFISLATMMVAFCAALIITLNGTTGVIIPLALLATVPITLFMFLQFPLLVEIFVSTYGPSIINSEEASLETLLYVRIGSSDVDEIF